MNGSERVNNTFDNTYLNERYETQRRFELSMNDTRAKGVNLSTQQARAIHRLGRTSKSHRSVVHCTHRAEDEAGMWPKVWR